MPNGLKMSKGGLTVDPSVDYVVIRELLFKLFLPGVAVVDESLVGGRASNCKNYFA